MKKNYTFVVIEDTGLNLCWFEPKYDEHWTDSYWQIELWTHSSPGSSIKTELRTPPKSPNFEPLQPEMGQTQAQIWNNRTSNLPNPSSSTKVELRTHLNPSKISNFKHANWVRPYTRPIIQSLLPIIRDPFEFRPNVSKSPTAENSEKTYCIIFSLQIFIPWDKMYGAN